MAEKLLREKIGWKPGVRVLLVGLPTGLANPFDGVEHAVATRKGEVFDLVLGFAANRLALKAAAKTMLGAANEETKLWVCYPKAGKLKTDINRDAGWEPLFDAGWIVVSIASVDATWSAVRFRPKHRVKSVRC